MPNRSDLNGTRLKTDPNPTVFSRILGVGDDPAPALDSLLESVGGIWDRIRPGDTVLVKPNFVAPFPDATTDFAFIDFFIRKIREVQGIPIVGESSGYEFDTEKTFDILGIREFLKERDVKLVNFDKDRFVRQKIGEELPAVEIAETAHRAKMVINLPVLKGHTITRVTGAVKNFFGILSKRSRRRLHCHGLHDAISALARRFENALHFVDARNLLDRAVFGDTRPLNVCLAGKDPFALDHAGCGLLGIHPSSVHYLKHVPEYEIRGTIPFTPFRTEKAKLKKTVHRSLYSAFYMADHAAGEWFASKSLIPYFHWYLGIRPAIGNISAGDMRRLSEICPVGAMDIDNRKIVREKCMMVRCMKCFHEGPPGAVKLKGFNTKK